MKRLIVLAMSIFLMENVIAELPADGKNGNLIDALIIGSAESPDPVLERVTELEKKGMVKDVVVLESFPLQIHLKATKEVIEELKKIPRKQNKTDGLR
jgi:hypothetical protein